MPGTDEVADYPGELDDSGNDQHVTASLQGVEWSTRDLFGRPPGRFHRVDPVVSAVQDERGHAQGRQQRANIASGIVELEEVPQGIQWDLAPVSGGALDDLLHSGFSCGNL